MRTTRTLALSCLLGTLTLALPSAAQQPSPPAKMVVQAMTEKARQLFAEGVKAYQQSRWADAHAAFLAAWALSKHYSIAGNLADCELKLGMYREAAEHFARYVREMAKDPGSTPQERKDGDARFALAKAKVALAEVQVTPAGAEVYVDGKLVGAAPLEEPLFLDPGPHVVEARSDGYVQGRATVTATAGAGVPVALALSRVPVEVPPVPVKDKGGQPPRRSLAPGLVMGGTALAGVAAGVGLVVGGAGKRTTATNLSQAILSAHHSCVPGAQNFDATCPAVESATKTSDTWHDAGVGVLIGAGVVAVAAGAYFLWPAPQITIAPTAGMSGGGLLLNGSF